MCNSGKCLYERMDGECKLTSDKPLPEDADCHLDNPKNSKDKKYLDNFYKWVKGQSLDEPETIY
jgi:hypothetical protein